MKFRSCFPSQKERPVHRWLFDLSKNGVAVSSYQIGLFHETEFNKVQDQWVPKFVIEKTREKYSETRFFDLEVNSPLDENEFFVKSLPVRDDRVLVRVRRGESIRFRDYKD